MIDENVLAVITIAIVLIALIALIFVLFKIERRDKQQLSDAILGLRSLNVKSVDRQVKLQNSAVPTELLRGRFGSAKLDPYAHLKIKGARAFLFGYRSYNDNIDIYANRSIVIIESSPDIQASIITCGRGIRKNILRDIDGYEEFVPNKDIGKINILLNLETAVLDANSGRDAKKVYERFSESFFNKFKFIEWVETGGGYIALIGPRKINVDTLEQLGCASEEVVGYGGLFQNVDSR